MVVFGASAALSFEHADMRQGRGVVGGGGGFRGGVQTSPAEVALYDLRAVLASSVLSLRPAMKKSETTQKMLTYCTHRRTKRQRKRPRQGQRQR